MLIDKSDYYNYNIDMKKIIDKFTALNLPRWKIYQLRHPEKRQETIEKSNQSDKRKQWLKKYSQTKKFRAYKKFYETTTNRKLYMREWYRKYTKNNPLIVLAHRLANKNKLELKKNQCEKCKIKNVRLYMHHSDYSKPLEIITLCNPCHKGEKHGSQ